MLVDTGMQTHADGTADGLGHFALVDWPQPSLLRMLDSTHGRHKLGYHREVLWARCQPYQVLIILVHRGLKHAL